MWMTASRTDIDVGPDLCDTRFFGQPRVLANLFGVELWERFSFYGMQGILLIYLCYFTAQGGLGISETTATSIVGAYGGAVYFATILGAWIGLAAVVTDVAMLALTRPIVRMMKGAR
jgi:proton-dependent oligopeptide transporter, POT family